MKSSALLLALCGSLASALAGTAYADCFNLPPEKAFAEASLVFVADVLDAETTAGSPDYRVTLNVLEPYKGISVGKHTLTFVHSVGYFVLQAGQRVLVFAFPIFQGSSAAEDVAAFTYTTSCFETRLVSTLQDPSLNEWRRRAKRRR